MKHSILCLSVVACSLLLVECSSYDDQPRESLSLAGEWRTSVGLVRLPGTTDLSHRGDSTVDSTSVGQLARRYHYIGALDYEARFELPEQMEGRHLELYLERTKGTTLWVDGDSVGTLRHLLTPQVYDLTGLNLEAGPHTLRLRVDNGPGGVRSEIGGSHAVQEATQTNWNGVLGAVRLDAMTLTHISHLRCSAVYDHARSDNPTGPSAHGVVRLRATIEANDEEEATLSATLSVPGALTTNAVKKTVALNRGRNEVDLELEAFEVGLWSEWQRQLYNVVVRLETGHGVDQLSEQVGFRKFEAVDGELRINGQRTFLRGKHDACVFPLTGCPPMDKSSWQRLFETAKTWGINHYRFHSWTPPEAAFAAADEAGIYLQPELPYWGCLTEEKKEERDKKKEGCQSLNGYLLEEGFRILDEYGGHPSFVMMALGNELCGDTGVWHAMVDSLRRHDNRHLYAAGSNNNIGWTGPMPFEDFLVTCRVGGDAEEPFDGHTRASFSFCDADQGGILNSERPSLRRTFDKAVARSPIPIIGHETCQYQIYPDFGEIGKYTGVLAPTTLLSFQKSLRAHGLDSLNVAFHRASGRFAMRLYKADIEMNLRTSKMSGFQLLDLQDYPGQGAALVGPLDAFMENKGLIQPEEWRRFCSEVVPLALMEKVTYSNRETPRVTLAVANYGNPCTPPETVSPGLGANSGAQPAKGMARWQLLRGQEVVQQGEVPCNAPAGRLSTIGDIELPLNGVQAPTRLTLTLAVGQAYNEWPLWVYADAEQGTRNKEHSRPVREVHSLSERVLHEVENGGTVLLTPNVPSNAAQLSGNTVGGLFTTDYWNYAMFKKISEQNHRPVSPGTMGYLIASGSPLFRHFPTDEASDLQWWSIARASRPLILDGTSSSLRPEVWAIDNVCRNHKLGVVFGVSVGRGRVLVCMTDLSAVSDSPEGRQWRRSLLDYASSLEFQPTCRLTGEELRGLLTRRVEEGRIEAVENKTDYQGE